MWRSMQASWDGIQNLTARASEKQRPVAQDIMLLKRLSKKGHVSEGRLASSQASI
jgi:hypothetical protein